jgi:deoxyguanosine kinase
MSIICIEGCLGVGKSSLVQRCAERLNAERLNCAPFYEEIALNPFLSDFYRDKRYAIYAQYTFLMLQERQFRAAIEYAKQGNNGTVKRRSHAHALPKPGASVSAICDFHPFKSLIFSSVVLQPEQRVPLKQVYELLHIPLPDLVVYLRADEDTILARLRRRNDDYLSDIDYTYITQLCSAYDAFFRTYNGPHVTIDTTHIDYVSNPQEISVLFQQIPLIFSSLMIQKDGQ